MTEPTKPMVRYRVNVSSSVKGVKTFDCTVELVDEWDGESLDWLQREVLEECERLVAGLDARCPAGNGNGNGTAGG